MNSRRRAETGEDGLLWKNRVRSAMERDAEELLELVSELIRFPSENPPGSSEAISRFIEHYLQQNGIRSEWHEAAPGMWNLVSRVGEGSPGRKLIFCGHTDVVPAGDRARWSFDPFAGHRDDTWIYGRGATDMKGGLAGLLFAAAVLKREGVPLGGELVLAVVPDEESGGQWGIPWLLERGYLSGDGCIIAEPAFPCHPTIGQKGCVRLRIRVLGRPAHSALAPRAGENAIVAAGRVLEAVAEAASSFDCRVPEPMELLMARSKQFLDHVGLHVESQVLDQVCYNVGTIQGGSSVNMVPDACVLECDIRIPVGLTTEQVLDVVKERLERLNLPFEMEPFSMRSEPNWTEETNCICRLLTSNIEWLTGQASYGVLQWAASDARHFRQYGIPVLQYGPACLSTIHQYDEKVPVADTIRCAQAYAATAIDFLQEEE